MTVTELPLRNIYHRIGRRAETRSSWRNVEAALQFLVRLNLSSGARPNTEAEGLAFIEDYIFPTLKRRGELQKERW